MTKATAKKTEIGVALAFGLLLVILPLLGLGDYYMHLAILFLMWVTLGNSWNLVGGYLGQHSFGHAAFFGMGAYTTGLFYYYYKLDPWIGLVLGGITTMLLAIPLGYIIFRLRGPYFALSMLASAEILRYITLNWNSLTLGAEGILLPPYFKSKISYYYIILALMIAFLVVTYMVIRSKLGFYFVAVREDQDAAEALSINSTKYKVYALMISAVYAGTMGSFYTVYMAFIQPDIVFSLTNFSIAMILVAVLGGIGTFWGPVFGALIITVLQESFRRIFASEGFLNSFESIFHFKLSGSPSLLIYGILIIVVILFMPDGMVGGLRRLFRVKEAGEKAG
jgi:branched-chain amino acid transport system permease protein